MSIKSTLGWLALLLFLVALSLQREAPQRFSLAHDTSGLGL